MVAMSEHRWLLRLVLFVWLLTTLPYLVGYWRAGSEWVYSGFLLGVEDGNSYIAKMLRGAAGDWLFRTPYSAEEQNGVVAFLPYTLLGKLTSPPAQHEQLVALFHLFRLAGSALYVIATYRFLAIFLADIRSRQFGTLLATFGGGLGWLAFTGLRQLFHQGLPLEFYSPETFGFLSVLSLPHLAAGRGFLLFGFIQYLNQEESPVVPKVIAGGLSWLALGFLQPATVLVGFAIIVTHLVVSAVLLWWKRNQQWSSWRYFLMKGAGICILSAPLPLYTLIAFRSDAYLSGWEQQNIILSPPIWDYLLAFAILLPLALLALKAILQQPAQPALFLIAWAVAFPLLAYAPHSLQRRLPDGFWVALVALALLGIQAFRSRTWAYRYLSLAFVSTFFLWVGTLFSVWQLQSPLYLSRPEAEAFQFLSSQAEKDSVLLASFPTSNPAPAWAPVRTIIGHGPESVNIKQNQPRVEAFYAGETSDSERLALLNEFSVDYVYWGPVERDLGKWNPADSTYLEKVYDQDGQIIFKSIVTSKQN